VGVAVFSHPVNDKTLTNVFPIEADGAVELGRFVLLDEVPANGETWMLGRCFELLRRNSLEGVVSFSDDIPRTAESGGVVFPGHIGTIYQAHNARYLGRGTPRTLRLLPDGTVLSDRCIQKLRKREQGWNYTAELLVEHGASQPWDDLKAWAKLWVQRLTRKIRHPGNHKYAWGLTWQMQKHLVATESPARKFPKKEAS
jgi:hypothetical protein